MASVNRVILIGNLGKDPEVRHFPNGDSVANLTIATSRQWKDKTSGEKQEETEWHRLVAYGRIGEIIGEYLKKGSSAYFEGRLKTRKWTDKDGHERYTTEIVVEQMTMLGSKRDREGGGGGGTSVKLSTAGSGGGAGGSGGGAAPAAKRGTGFDDMDDDIPF